MLDGKRGAYLLPPESAPIAADEPSAAETIARGLGIVRRQIFLVLALAASWRGSWRYLCPEIAPEIYRHGDTAGRHAQNRVGPTAYGF